jgi:hypothetical protein
MNTQTLTGEAYQELCAMHAVNFDRVMEDHYGGDLETMRLDFDFLGPFAFARNLKLLVNNSGEETALKFMTLYNNLNPGTY